MGEKMFYLISSALVTWLYLGNLQPSSSFDTCYINDCMNADPSEDSEAIHLHVVTQK